ncbi:hypothetical protein [Pseudonocardia sp. Ae707_Ps1]|uniref:hypothetical protein n=1 Tax=Pseudonocardia sp. Ae707_Ps1 TaxID=1885572 RepID=UPI000AEEEC76|nr:hypothetical protein [Pseudonocardia sp. Ae707_Ps1]
MGLDEALRAVGDAWQKVNSGGTWQADKNLADYAGYWPHHRDHRRPNGWHPHVHAVLVFNSRPP